MSSISIRGAKHTDSMLNLGSFIVLELIKKIRGKDHMVVDLAETLICEINSFNYVYGGMETGQSKMPKLRYLRLL
tara:strand:+ start:2794 stop:3018 length:225 start_codon:yes stop_codon:yes gene_type:complete